MVEIHKLVTFIWNEEELPDQWREYIIVSIYKKGVIIMGYHCYHFIQNVIQHPSVKVN
jgi:hypothetical protein